MESRGTISNGNCSGPWNTGEKESISKLITANLAERRMRGKKCSGFFFLETVDIFKMEPRNLKRAPDSDLRRGALISPRRKSRTRGRRASVHHGGMELTRVGASATSLRDIGEDFVILRNVLL